MATSNSYFFLPNTGELVIAAYRRIGVHRSEILTEHFADAKMEANLLQAQWANLGPLLWTVDLQTVVLIPGKATYSVPANTVMMLDVYISLGGTPGSFNQSFNQSFSRVGTSSSTDRIITPISRTEYASMPNKGGQGSPTCFWFDRLISPTFTLWPTPDGSEPTLSYYRFTQPQDAVMTNALNPQIPYLALDGWVAGLSHRLARIYKPDRAAEMEADAQKAINLMLTQLTENVPLYIQPITGGYWR